MSDFLVCTICHGEAYLKVAEVTHPRMKAYAERIGADFKNMVINPLCDLPDGFCPPWMKLPGIHKNLGLYKRIIFLDTDVLLRDDMPNLFEVVPEDKFGAFFEGQVTDRLMSIDKAMGDYSITSPLMYDGQYFNSCVFVCSRRHRDLFIIPDELVNNFYEQGLPNARLFASGDPVEMLSYKFNRMTLVDGLVGEDRQGSYVVHYAGMITGADKETLSENADKAIANMKEDIRAWDEKQPVITRIHCAIGGGLGDVVCTEPLLRAMIDDHYANQPDTRIIISTSYPRVFEHFELSYNNVRVVDDEKVVREEWRDKFHSFVRLASHDHHSPVSVCIPYPEIHNQDFNSYSLTKSLLTPDRRTIRLSIKKKDYAELFDAAKVVDWLDGAVRNSVAIHPGTGWASKTFPVGWWNEVIEGLVDFGMKPVIFGKNVNQHHGVLNVNTKHCVDLRNNLSIGGMVALNASCPVLLSNDSAPIHIAGAFDNEIVMIATTKRAELVLPYRYGRTNYKAIGLANKCVPDCHGVKPNGLYHVCTHSDLPKGMKIEDFLPEPELVVRTVLERMK